MVVTSSDRAGRAKAKQPGNREWVTVIQAVCADGWSIPPFTIVKGAYILDSWYREFKLPRGWRIAVSDNGWTTNENGLDWIKHFNTHTEGRKIGGYRLLILDGHESHHSAEFELYCKDHNIITLCMPAHSSHILQPLDVGCFSPLKKAYGKQIEGYMRGGQTYIAKEDFFPAFQVAFQDSITASNIQGGFKGAGLSPFDPQRVLETLPPCAATPSPSNSRPSTAHTWQPQTPKNATQASRQSIFIKNRISSHQGSSPSYIIDAVNQFTKGSVAIMHEVALLRSRIDELEETNDRLSKRRKTKKTRLQKGGSLSVEEAEALIALKEGGSQGNEEIGSSNGNREGAQLRTKRCSNCSKTGHNARTCKRVLETSKEDDLY
jgi:hypothetical protein